MDAIVMNIAIIWEEQMKAVVIVDKEVKFLKTSTLHFNQLNDQIKLICKKNPFLTKGKVIGKHWKKVKILYSLGLYLPLFCDLGSCQN